MSRGLGTTQRAILDALAESRWLTIEQLAKAVERSPRQVRTAVHALAERHLVMTRGKWLRVRLLTAEAEAEEAQLEAESRARRPLVQAIRQHRATVRLGQAWLSYVEAYPIGESRPLVLVEFDQLRDVETD